MSATSSVILEAISMLVADSTISPVESAFSFEGDGASIILSSSPIRISYRFIASLRSESALSPIAFFYCLCPRYGTSGRHWIWGEKGGHHRGQPKCAQCELRSFLVIGEVEKVNGVLYILRLVRSFLVIGEEEKTICTVSYIPFRD